MLLIDAANIHVGGGLVLLKYLVKEIENQNIAYKLIVRKNDIALESNHKIKLNGSYFFSRNKILKQVIATYHPKLLFCFGNFAPLFKPSNIPVITYVHNPMFTLDFNSQWFSIKDNLLIRIKAFYFRLSKINSYSFIFQTHFIKNKYINKFSLDKEKCLVLPFFDLKKIQTQIKEINTTTGRFKKLAFIYVSSSDPHKNHRKLFQAWELLAKNNLFPKLYITLPLNSKYTKSLKKYLHNLVSIKINIHDLGQLNFEDALSKTAGCEFCIYPTLSETLGLGLVEGALLDCKVISSKIDCLHEVIKPSLSFNPECPESIAQAIEKALHETLPESEVLLENKINTLIEYLNSYDKGSVV